MREATGLISETRRGLIVPGMETSPHALMTYKERMTCLTFIGAYPIQNGTESTMWCSYREPAQGDPGIFGQTGKQLGPISPALAT